MAGSAVPVTYASAWVLVQPFPDGTGHLGAVPTAAGRRVGRGGDQVLRGVVPSAAGRESLR